MRHICPAVTLTVTVTGVLALMVSGCQQAADSGRGAARLAGASYLLDAEPPAAQSVVDVRALVEESKAPTDVVVVGRIGGLSQPTWDPERAAFMVADLSLAGEAEAAQAQHDETPQHDVDNCPFCRDKRKKQLAGLALVQVIDPAGSVPAVDARQLLGLRDGQTVVVRGRAEIDNSLGALVVSTDGIYVRP